MASLGMFDRLKSEISAWFHSMRMQIWHPYVAALCFASFPFFGGWRAWYDYYFFSLLLSVYRISCDACFLYAYTPERLSLVNVPIYHNSSVLWLSACVFCVCQRYHMYKKKELGEKDTFQPDNITISFSHQSVFAWLVDVRMCVCVFECSIWWWTYRNIIKIHTDDERTY